MKKAIIFLLPFLILGCEDKDTPQVGNEQVHHEYTQQGRDCIYTYSTTQLIKQDGITIDSKNFSASVTHKNTKCKDLQ